MKKSTNSLRELLARYKFLKVSPDDLIRHVARLMPDHHSSAAVVMDENDKLIGIISEQDIVEKTIAVRRNVDETFAKDIMTPNPFTITLDESFNNALKLMTKYNIRTIPVMDNDEVIGILDIRDLYSAFSKSMEEEISLKNSLISYAYGDGYGAGFKEAI